MSYYGYGDHVQDVTRREKREAVEEERVRVTKQYEERIAAVKREAAEKLEALRRSLQETEETVSYLLPPKFSKNEYLEQKAAQYVFKCKDGDIQIPEFGIFRSDFYCKERIYNPNNITLCNLHIIPLTIFILIISKLGPAKSMQMDTFITTNSFQDQV